jgi:hypothetical protein
MMKRRSVNHLHDDIQPKEPHSTWFGGELCGGAQKQGQKKEKLIWGISY